MSESVELLKDYLPVLIVMGITAVFALGALLAGLILKPKNRYKEKLGPWECGVDPYHEADVGRFTVQFYIIAVLFVIFDVETLFLFPWAVVLKSPGMGLFVFIEMFLFIVILLVGFFYAWKKGALEWVK